MSKGVGLGPKSDSSEGWAGGLVDKSVLSDAFF